MTCRRQALREYPRYLKALALRGERALRDPARDQARMLELKPFDDALAEARARDEAQAPGWQALRWELEELRVSLFAQELGARGGVSPKKLAARLAQLASVSDARSRPALIVCPDASRRTTRAQTDQGAAGSHPDGGRRPRERRSSLDPLHLGARVVALDLHVPLVADQARRDLTPDRSCVRRRAWRVDLLPDLAVIERVAAALPKPRNSPPILATMGSLVPKLRKPRFSFSTLFLA